MKVKEISVNDWDNLNFLEDTYFCNGCVFDEKTDNLIAFSWYENELHEVRKYFEIIKD